MLMNGIPVAFSSQGTLTVDSSCLKEGSKGDVDLLKPKLLHTTPLILDDLKRTISRINSEKSVFYQKAFDFFLDYSIYWMNQGYHTTFTNLFIFSSVKKRTTGGNLKILLVSNQNNDLMSKTTELFMRSTLDVQIVSGFSCTESTGFVTLTSLNDNQVNSCGSLLPGYSIKLKDCNGFYSYDHPNSRGQILVSGEAVSNGYLNQTLEEQSFEKHDNISWFSTGVICSVDPLPSNSIYIIDSADSMVRLSFGSSLTFLGRSESELRSSLFIQNICLYGNQDNNFIIGFLSPVKSSLTNLCKSLDIEEGSLSFNEMCCDPEVQAEVTKAIIAHGIKGGLSKKVLPSKIKICTEDWNSLNLVTSDSKPIRSKIASFYQKDVNRMFGVIDHNSNEPSRRTGNNNNNNNNRREVSVVEMEETGQGIEMIVRSES